MAMPAPVNQKEYLKKYLSGDKKKKEKKKKKKEKDASKRKGLNLIEDTTDINDIPFGYFEEDDAPTIAEITYDDESTKVIEEFKSNSKKWKNVVKPRDNQESPEDNFSSQHISSFSRVDSNSPSHSQLQHSDASPPRRKRHDSVTPPPKKKSQDPDASPLKKQYSHLSPPRRKRHDSGASPLRRKRHDSGASPPRRKRHDSGASPPRRKRHDSGASPPRRKWHNSDVSPPRKKRHDSDASPPRKIRHDSDASPPRTKRHDSDALPSRRKRHDSDASPPRRKRHDSDASPSSRKRQDSDASPPRRKRHDSDASPQRRKRHDSDASPPRRKRHDSDTSPPRRKRHDSDASPPRRDKNNSNNGRPVADITKRPEKQMTTQEYLRARKFGKLKKETPEDLLRKEREAKLQEKAQEKYKEWNKGVVQNESRRESAAATVHEMGKSFARGAEDKDMNEHLKDVMREEDPMLQYVMRKKDKEDNRPQRPSYQGSFPPNRFKIRPGYRWDGVDRSTGYEKDWFAKQNSKKAVDEESYKWSVEDM